MNELRLCEIREIEFSQHTINNNRKEINIFHKWFDGINDTCEFPVQYAIVEDNEGKIKKISIEQFEIRFLTKDEISKIKREEIFESITEMFGDK